MRLFHETCALFRCLKLRPPKTVCLHKSNSALPSQWTNTHAGAWQGHKRRAESRKRAPLGFVLMYGIVWEWMDTSAAWLRKKWGGEREEWYGPAGVAMGTQLLKPGRVIVEEMLCAADATRCHLEAVQGSAQTAGPGLGGCSVNPWRWDPVFALMVHSFSSGLCEGL